MSELVTVRAERLSGAGHQDSLMRFRMSFWKNTFLRKTIARVHYITMNTEIQIMKEDYHSQDRQKRGSLQQETDSEDSAGRPPQRTGKRRLSQKQITWIIVWVIQLLILSLVLALSSR